MSSNIDEGSGYYLFGRDIMSIPGLRSSFLAGFSSSLGTSLLTFMFTSNVSKSFKYGQLAFVAVTFPSWYILNEIEYEKASLVEQAQKEIQVRNAEEYILLDSLEFGSETFG